MSAKSTASFPIRSTALMAVLMLTPAGGRTQDSTPKSSRQRQSATSSVPVAESLRDVEARVQQLNVMLSAMSAEVTRSRDEVKQLRQEIHATRSELAALRSSPLDPGSPPGEPGAPQIPPDDLPAATHTTRLAPLSSSTGQEITQPYTNTEASDNERLARIEEDQQLLSGKVDEQYQTKVESASKYRVRLSGMALLNAFSNQGTVDNIDLPTVALNRRPLDSGGSFGATVRQSTIGLEVFGPTVAHARTSAEIQADFFGGAPVTPDGFTSGLVRLRTATMRLDWTRTSIVGGQDAPFFSPLSPTSFAALGLPAFSYSGNLWTWTPQVRIEHRVDLDHESSLLFQGGILDPLSGELPVAQFYRYPDAGERSRQPAYAARLSWTHGVGARAFTFGTGGYYARQSWGYNRTVNAWASTLDWSLPLSNRISLSGEFYRGSAVGGLGAATGRSVLFSGPASDPNASVIGLNTLGGWAQLKYKATGKWEFNGAFGDDSPDVSDLRRFPASRNSLYSRVSRNQSAFVNFVYHPRSNLLFSAEYRRLSTSQVDAGKLKAGQVNVGVGVRY